MATLDRYILRQLIQALVLVLVTLVMLGWLTQVIRLLELAIGKGRSVVEFFSLTFLMLPLIAALVAPTALFIACIFVLYRLASGSELVVLGGAGISPWRLLRPFMAVGLVVMAAILAVNLYASPLGKRMFSEKLTKLRSDIITTLIEEGQFATPETGLMIHIKEQTRGGELVGLIVDDTRDPDAAITYLAKRARLVDEGGQALLLLLDGNVLRSRTDGSRVDLVNFQQYTLNLTDYVRDAESTYLRPNARFLSELLNPDEDDTYARAFPLKLRAEIHDRLSNPLYALVVVLIAFAVLSQTRSTRESRIVAIIVASVVASLIRMGGLFAVSMAGKTLLFAPLIYGVPLLAIGGAVALIIVHGARGSARFSGSVAGGAAAQQTA